MRFAYLESAKRDLVWFRKYYSSVFPEGRGNARRQYRLMKLVLTENPRAGHPVGERDSRLYVITRTPFSVIYRLRPGRIEVLAIHDGRSGSYPDYV
jgi:plasmid stabilization system protein ParE